MWELLYKVLFQNCDLSPCVCLQMLILLLLPPNEAVLAIAMVFFIIVVVHIELITSTNLDMDAN